MRRHPRVRLRYLDRGDTATIDRLFAGLSPASRHARFHAPVHRLSDRFRVGLAAVDGRDHVAVVAHAKAKGRWWEPVGIARFVRQSAGGAEVAIAVVDAWQGRGVGERLLGELRRVGLALEVDHFSGTVLRSSEPALRLLRRAFPQVRTTTMGDVVHFVVPLVATAEDLRPTQQDVLADLGAPVAYAPA